MMRLDLIIPLLTLLSGAILTLVIGIFLPRRRQTACAWLAAGVMTFALIAAVFQALRIAPQTVFDGSFAADRPLLWTLAIMLVAALAGLLLAVPVFRHDAREAEFYVMLLFALTGVTVLAGAADLMEILLGVLLTSVASYALVAWRRADPMAMEAVLKYYLIGALANIALIYGLIWLYGLSGSTLLGNLGGIAVDNRFGVALALTLVLIGLGFKAGYVPVHSWIPDVYQGTTVPVAALLSVLPKLAGVLAVARLVTALPAEIWHWPSLIALLAAVTMTWGNLAAYRQNDIRRLLGYSSIAQSGYLLMAVVAMPYSTLALPGLLYYFAAYAVANVGAFAVLAASGRMTITGNSGLVRRHPWLVVTMAVALLSLMGLPPLAGFVAKFALFTATVEAGYLWLTVVALINTVLSLYYYLRVLAPMVFDSERQPLDSMERWGYGVALGCAAATVLLGLGAFAMLDYRPVLRLLH